MEIQECISSPAPCIFYFSTSREWKTWTRIAQEKTQIHDLAQFATCTTEFRRSGVQRWRCKRPPPSKHQKPSLFCCPSLPQLIICGYQNYKHRFLMQNALNSNAAVFSQKRHCSTSLLIWRWCFAQSKLPTIAILVLISTPWWSSYQNQYKTYIREDNFGANKRQNGPKMVLYSLLDRLSPGLQRRCDLLCQWGPPATWRRRGGCAGRHRDVQQQHRGDQGGGGNAQ